MGPRGFAQVVTQGRRRRASQREREHRFRPIVLEARRGIEPLELGVRERVEHAVGATARRRKQRGPLADPEHEVVDVGATRIARRHAGLAENLEVHVEAVEEAVDAAVTHR